MSIAAWRQRSVLNVDHLPSWLHLDYYSSYYSHPNQRVCGLQCLPPLAYKWSSWTNAYKICNRKGEVSLT
jgi:hypothetical protein